MIDHEVALTGGNINASVLRVGNTVRRATTAASPAVHRLLEHLAQKAFVGSPRFLGIDAQGREILTYLEGESGILASIWPHDEPLLAAAHLLRAYHDAVADFVPHEAQPWAFRYPDPARCEIICHNDFAPYNFIYRHGLPYAIIDFDLAGPGPRLRDVAYAAYWMVPLSFHSDDQRSFAEADVTNGSRRLRLFCDTYGTPVEPALFEMIAEVLAFMGNEEAMRQIVGDLKTEQLHREGHLAHWQCEADAFGARRAQIETNLYRTTE